MIVQGAEDAIIGQTLDGGITSWNVGAERLFGYTAAEALGATTALLEAPGSEEQSASLRRRVRLGERPPLYEARRSRKDGASLAVSISASPVLDGRGQLIGMSEIIRPIPVFAIAPSPGWSSAGQIAAGLAHELNQPLVAISTFLAAARRLAAGWSSPDSTLLLSTLERAREQAKRAADIVRHLRDFASPQREARQPASLRQTFIDVENLAQVNAHQASVELHFHLDADQDIVVDHIQIQQVFLNLIRNAIDAMANAPRRKLQISGRKQEDRVLISVTDSGPGVPSEIAHRLFEPFVTSKADGMGVGLAISRTIVEAHGGQLWLDPAAVPGATFHFTLPIMQAAPAPRPLE
ncbi:MAG: ATP-binding protein [Caulobacteraceae bacterium]